MTSRKVLRIGHRGACGYAPENTRAALRTAISLGCDLAEVDVRRTRDGHLVLLHDETVDRTTTGRGRLAHMALSDVQTLDAGGKERVPTLKEALQVADGRMGLVLELKDPIGEDTYALVRRSAFRGPVVYASFAADQMRAIRAVDPEAATMALMDELPHDPVSYVLNAQATHAGLRFDTVTNAMIEAFHEGGLSALVYTVNESRDIRRVRSFGVDGIISDFPDRI